MSSSVFLTRVVAVILSVVTFHILGIEFLIFFVLSPSLEEFLAMLLCPLPLAVSLVFAYMVITYYFLKPVLLFLRTVGDAITPDAELIKKAQNRCLNLSYFLSALSFPAYILGGTGGVWIVRHLYPHWPAHILIYGFMAGVIAGLLTIPMSEYATAWAIKPVLGIIVKNSPDFGKSRFAGMKIPLRFKFVIIIVVMVIGITGYTAIISYSMIHSGIENMKKIETLLPAASDALLADDAGGANDARVRSYKYFESRMGSLKMFFAGTIIIGSLLSLVVAFAAAGAITRPLRLFIEIAEKIKNGRYDKTIAIISNDEFADLGASFNRMTGTLLSHLQQNQELIKSISQAVDTLNPMSQELFLLADLHAAGSTQQLSATADAEESGRKIAETAREIAANAANITRNSETTQAITREGQKRLGETETGLKKISEKMEHIAASVTRLKKQSLEIDNIVETIKKISGRTNILSLSAGIEATKAGEAGKRFGVVAEEIRHLAQDAAKSAKRIRKNIEGIQESVAMSISFARAGEQSVNDGENAMSHMTDQFEEIARANVAAVQSLKTIESITARQAESNEKLSRILSIIRSTTQETSAASGQTHESIKSLKNLINQLKAQTRLQA